MVTTEELLLKYRSFSDEDLLGIYLRIDEYSPEAKEALTVVLKEKGGIDLIKSRVEKQLNFAEEERRIKALVNSLIIQKLSKTELIEKITSEILSREEIQIIIDREFQVEEIAKEDRKITFRTVVGSILGAFVSGTVGGVIWGLQMIYSNHIFVAVAGALAVMCYGTIKLFSKKSEKNIIVIVFTVLAFVYAVIIGEIMYEIVGYIE